MVVQLYKFYYSGTVELRIQDSLVSLFADEEHSIIGKALVIHEGIGYNFTMNNLEGTVSLNSSDPQF